MQRAEVRKTGMVCSRTTVMGGMKGKHLAMLFFFALSLVSFQIVVTQAQAQSSYFTNRGCAGCHAAPAVASCNACHYHGNRSLAATTNKTSYAPGETVSVTLTSASTRSGWIKAILYNQTGAQVAVSNGNASGMGGSTTFPATLTAPAPTTAGSYTWKMAYFGNSANNGDVHGQVAVNTNSFTVVAAGDTAAPTVSAFTLPATGTSLTVPVSAFIATDNTGVTGYLITKSSAAPAASAAGWSAAAPASVTAVAGVNTFYGWAKDAAGNVSAGKSTTVTVTLPDTAAPTVSAFTLPATATSLNVPVSSFTATDNVGVTGYLITTSSATPSALSTAWTAAPPSNATAAAPGSVTFYAWAKDAAGNVSLAKSAAVAITIADTTRPVVNSFTVPATATALNVPVTAFTATDNVGVTGYQVTTSAVAPAAASGWSAAAPANVTAVEGNNTFYAWAKDAAGNVSLAKTATVVVTTAVDATKPALAVSALASGSYTNKLTLNISGTASDASGIRSVTVNSQAVVLNPDGSFSTALNLVAGNNAITIIATDKAGNQQTDSRTITYDPTAPVLTVSSPADNSSSMQSFIALSGTVSETSTVTIVDNSGNPVTASLDGNSFTATVNLVPGVNTISITAADLAGNIISAKRTVTYDSGTLTLSVTYPNQDITTSKSELVLKGTIVDGVGNVTVKISMDGKSYRPAVRDGNFKQKLTFKKPGVYAVTIAATDAAGNSSTVTRNVIYRPGEVDDDHDDHDRKRDSDHDDDDDNRD